VKFMCVCVFAVIFQGGNAVPLFIITCNVILVICLSCMHSLSLSLSLSLCDILKKENVVVKHLVNNLFIGRKKCQWGTEQCMLYVVTPITKLKRCDIAKCYCKRVFCVRREVPTGFADDLSTLGCYTVLLGQ